LKFKALKKYARDMNLCSFCAACVANCAGYRATGWESYSSRGKVFLLKSREKGWFNDAEALRDRLFTCTLCRSCDQACDAGYKPSEVFHAARVEVVQAGNAPESVAKIIKALQENKNPAGLNPVARTQWVDEFTDLLNMDSNTLLFAGCNAAYKGKALVGKVLRLLNKIGIKPAALREEQCCGLVAYQIGNLPLTEELAGWNMGKLREKAIEQVVFVCPSCASFFAEVYPLLNQEFTAKPKLYFELLLEHIGELGLKNLKGRTVTYHDPCHLGRYLGLTEAPRAIIEKTGAAFVEMGANRDKASCCGGGAGLLAYNLDRSLKTAEARVRDALATQASILITPCTTCQETLEGAKFRIDEAMDLEVWNLLDLFEI
jgi:heterodisulfide reductase subunit D